MSNTIKFTFSKDPDKLWKYIQSKFLEISHRLIEEEIKKRGVQLGGHGLEYKIKVYFNLEDISQSNFHKYLFDNYIGRIHTDMQGDYFEIKYEDLLPSDAAQDEFYDDPVSNVKRDSVVEIMKLFSNLGIKCARENIFSSDLIR